jgi:hypothetical protein
LIKLSFSRIWSRATFSSCVFSVSFMVIPTWYARSPETARRQVITSKE